MIHDTPPRVENFEELRRQFPLKIVWGRGHASWYARYAGRGFIEAVVDLPLITDTLPLSKVKIVDDITVGDINR